MVFIFFTGILALFFLSSNSLVKTELLDMPWQEFMFHVTEAPVADFHKSHAQKLII